MTSPGTSPELEYSEVADEQLDELEATDASRYNAVLAACELIGQNPSLAQSMSAAVRTDNGIVFRFPVPDCYPYKVFWSSAGPRIEAVFPYK
jgi:hypothetical protein